MLRYVGKTCKSNDQFSRLKKLKDIYDDIIEMLNVFKTYGSLKSEPTALIFLVHFKQGRFLPMSDS